MADAVHPNLSLLRRLDLRNLDSCADIISDDFVWHYFNPKVPELAGDYRGAEGLNSFFCKLGEMSSGSFEVNVVDGRVVGDELVFTQTCNRLSMDATGGNTIEFDVIVVWRIVGGKIAEGWDIPSVYSVRMIGT